MSKVETIESQYKVCSSCSGTGKVKMCPVPKCPMPCAKRGKGRRRAFCGFHSKIENRGKFHPTQNIKKAPSL